jgi:hypothetical protein
MQKKFKRISLLVGLEVNSIKTNLSSLKRQICLENKVKMLSKRNTILISIYCLQILTKMMTKMLIFLIKIGSNQQLYNNIKNSTKNKSSTDRNNNIFKKEKIFFHRIKGILQSQLQKKLVYSQSDKRKVMCLITACKKENCNNFL